jgi:hypothetical protein
MSRKRSNEFEPKKKATYFVDVINKNVHSHKRARINQEQLLFQTGTGPYQP